MQIVLLVVVFTINTLICSSCIFVKPEHTSNRQRTIVLVGQSGVAKTAVGNCILNRSPNMWLIREFPFSVQRNSEAKIATKCNTTVIDTFCFRHSTRGIQSFIGQFRKRLDTVNNMVDMALFVIRKDYIGPELFTLFDTFRKGIFQARMDNNSALVCIDCPKGWLQTKRHVYPRLNEIMSSFDNRTIEITLRYDMSAKWVQERHSNVIGRMKAIAELNTFVDGLEMDKVSLAHVHNDSLFASLERYTIDSMNSKGQASIHIEQRRKTIVLVGNTGTF